MCIEKGVYELPQAGVRANKLLEERLYKFGYRQSDTTPGFWKHMWRPISFALIVDDFGVKYVGEQHAEYLLQALSKYHVVGENKKGDRYCGITIDWDYQKKKVHLSMPGYCSEVQQRFQHKAQKVQNQPHWHSLPAYGANIQYAKKEDDLPILNEDDKLFIQ